MFISLLSILIVLLMTFNGSSTTFNAALTTYNGLLKTVNDSSKTYNGLLKTVNDSSNTVNEMVYIVPVYLAKRIINRSRIRFFVTKT